MSVNLFFFWFTEFITISLLLYVFGFLAMRHVGSYLPDQESNLSPLRCGGWSLNHWAPGKSQGGCFQCKGSKYCLLLMWEKRNQHSYHTQSYYCGLIFRHCEKLYSRLLFEVHVMSTECLLNKLTAEAADDPSLLSAQRRREHHLIAARIC